MRLVFCSDVEDSVRLHYCALWKGIVLADEQAIQRASKGLGVHSPMMEALYPGRKGGISHTLLAAMLTQKGWNHVMDNDLSSLELPPPKVQRNAPPSTAAAEPQQPPPSAVVVKQLTSAAAPRRRSASQNATLRAPGIFLRRPWLLHHDPK